MKVYGQINYTGTMKYQGSTLNLEYIVDDYRHGLTLTKGYIGGGYISNAGWTVVTTIQNATDAWGTSATAALGNPYRYGGSSSSHINGYLHYSNQASYLYNKRMSFSTESVTGIADRNYGPYNPCFIQHGIGYNIDGGFYGTKAYSTANSSTNYDKFTFSNETWAAASDGNVYSGDGTYQQAWFDKNYGFSVASDNVTRMYTFSSETWSIITTNPAVASTGYSIGAWPKAIPTKEGKSSVHVGGNSTPILKFMHLTYSYQVNAYGQTLNNSEMSPVMGQSHGYYAGGYNGVQNAHTDRVEYNTDTVLNIPDAPRALSAGGGMWSGY